MLPATATRVSEATDDQVNAQISQETERNVACCAAGGGPAIHRRLAELDREWDIERTLELNAATIGLTSLILGATTNRKWLLLTGTVLAFLTQHAVQGWCPPVPVFRRLGFRTETEINEERYALKALRGDFQMAGDGNQSRSDRDKVTTVLEAVRR